MDSYLDIINRFWSHNRKVKFKSSTIALFFFLLKKWEESNYEQFITSERKIEKEIRMTRNTIRLEKQYLRNSGFITYHADGSSTVFQINTDRAPHVPLEIQSMPKEKKVKENSESRLKSQKTSFKSKELQKEKTTPSNPKSSKVEQTVGTKEIPTEEEFLNYARSMKIYKKSDVVDFKIIAKYNAWKENGWKNGYDIPIKNWKLSVQNSISYWIGGYNGNDTTIPTIKRPKNTYNE